MANIITYKKVTDLLSDIARRHYQINTFFVGEINDLNAENLTYPVFQMFPSNARFPQTNGEYKTIEMTLTCRVLDKQTQDGNNEIDVQNDTFAISQDIINELNQHPYYTRSNATLVGDITLNQLNEFMDDYTAGWEFNLNLQLVNNNTFCGLPMSDITGYSATGPTDTGYTVSYQYLQCNDSLSSCTYLDSFIDYKIATNTGSTANYYTTGATLAGTILVFNRNDMASAYTVDLSTLVVSNVLHLSGGTVTGNTYFTQNLTANTFNANIIQSGGTDLYNIFITQNDGNDITRIQPGLNTYTGGTGNYPTVNISAATLSSLTVSGNSNFTTIISGGTNLQDIINSSVTGVTSGITGSVNINGLNTYTGGSIANQTINISGLTIDNITVSGQSSFTTILSGGTNLQNVIQGMITGVTTGITSNIQNGLNTYTGGTALLPTVNISAATLATLNVSGSTSLGVLSATTMYSAGTDLYSIFLTTNDGNDITRVQPGLNTYTGGTGNLPTVNISGGTFDNITVSGSSSFASISATSIVSGSTDLNTVFSNIGNQLSTKANLSGATFTGNIYAPIITGGTLYSGATELSSVVRNLITGVTSGLTYTRVQPGSNTTTGGTADLPTVNVVASPSFNSITASGASSFTTLSATTIISGSTDLSFVFTPTAQTASIVSQLNTKANLSGATFTGNIYAPQVSGGTIYSGNTDLSLLIPAKTYVQNGLNTYTGGTASLPTVNVSGLTINNINVSGSATFNTISATTMSALTYYLSGQSIYDMFAKTGTTGQFIEIYTASTTWTVPDDVTSVVVEMWGGGGGGGCGAGVNNGGGGGASGSYILGTVTVVPGSAMTITVGSGGTAGWGSNLSNPNGFPSTNGGDTIFGTLRASGGTGGGNANWNTPTSGGIGGTAKQITANQNITNTLNYVFVKGYDGNNATSIPSTSSTAGGSGGDTVMFGRAKVLYIEGGTAGKAVLVDTPAVGASATYFGGGGAGGTGYFSNSGSTGGTGSAGLIVLRYNRGTGANYIYTNAFSGGTVIGATNFQSTISSGGTDLSYLFAVPSQITDLSNRLSTKANLSGATFTGAIVASSLSATTISGGTIFSGSSNLGTLFVSTATTIVYSVGQGTNITTGGTVNNPTINLTASPSINSLTASGASNFTGGLSANTLSGGTIYSGSTDVSSLFGSSSLVNTHTNQLVTKANLSGATFTGTVNAGVLSATTLSATTYFSGSTNLQNVIQSMITGVTSGITGSITGGTSVGTGIPVFSGVSGTNLAFRSLSAGTNITITSGDTITINGTTSNSSLPFNLGVAASDETTVLTSGNGKITFLTPRTGTLTKIVAGLTTSGSSTTSVRVNKNGVTVGTSTIDITANNFKAEISSPTLTATTFSAWDTYTVDITSAGTGAAGLKVYFEGSYSNPFTATTSTIPWHLGLAMSDETNAITTGTSKVTMLAPFSGTVTGVTISVSNSGSTLTTVNIKNNGTTIFSTKATIDANEFSSQTAATPPVITGSTLNIYDTLTFDIDGAGTGAKGLKVWLTGTRNI